MNKTLYLIAGALLAVGASSCSSDEPAGPEIAQKDETRYIRVNILNPDGSSSRADGDPTFEYGTEDENEVENIYMDFYDENGDFISRSFPSDMDETTPTEDPYPNVGKILSKVVKVGIEEGKGMPAYVMCYLNPVSYQNAATKMVDLRLAKRSDYKDASGKFAMNNSCYYGYDPMKSTNNTDLVKISGTPFPKDLKLYTNKTDAEADDAASIDIYVERYAAKVNFTLNTANGTGTGDAITGIHPYTVNATEKNKAYSLKFTPQAWTINAVEDEMYAVKNFSLDANNLKEGGFPPKKTEIDAKLTTWSGKWNDADRHRSYWACSPGYFSEDFPRVADDIADIHTTDATDGTKYGAGLAVNNFKQKYYSYNQIYDAANNKAGKYGNTGFEEADSKKPCMYALETTMGTAAFTSGNPKAAVPAVLVVGTYAVTYDSKALAANTTFYLWEGGIYFGTGVKDASNNNVDNAPSMLDKLLDAQKVLYTVNTGKTRLTSENKTGLETYLKVAHPDKDVRGTTAVPRRYVTLQISLPPAATLYWKKSDGTFAEVTSANINDVNKALWTQMSVAEAYTNGKCFYYIPIRHLRWTEDTPAAGKELETNGVINWGNLRSGDMGLVRNHVYTLGVQAIKGLATGIENPDYPILPAADNQYYIRYRINILNWRIVPTQGGIIL